MLLRSQGVSFRLELLILMNIHGSTKLKIRANIAVVGFFGTHDVERPPINFCCRFSSTPILLTMYVDRA